MSAIDNLLFDLDGTLTDPEAGIIGCFRFARDSLGDDDVMPDPGIVIGPPLRDSFRDLLTDPGDDRVEAAVRLYQKQFSESGMYDNVAYPEIPQTLTALGEHSRLFVVTSKPTHFSEQILYHFGLLANFEVVYGSRPDGRHADKAGLIADAIANESLHPGRTIMIGDRNLDIRGAAANGVASIGVLWGFGDRAEHEAAGATHIC
jgi:phosphoglycolate phosphatase